MFDQSHLKDTYTHTFNSFKYQTVFFVFMKMEVPQTALFNHLNLEEK